MLTAEFGGRTKFPDGPRLIMRLPLRGACTSSDRPKADTRIWEEANRTFAKRVVGEIFVTVSPQNSGSYSKPIRRLSMPANFARDTEGETQIFTAMYVGGALAIDRFSAQPSMDGLKELLARLQRDCRDVDMPRVQTRIQSTIWRWRGDCSVQ